MEPVILCDGKGDQPRGCSSARIFCILKVTFVRFARIAETRTGVTYMSTQISSDHGDAWTH